MIRNGMRTKIAKQQEQAKQQEAMTTLQEQWRQ